MIKLLSGFPDDVVACLASGRVTKADYVEVLVPAVEKALAAHPKIRFYYEIAPEFQAFDAGAMWEDAKVGVEHLTRWERIAIVSDVEWIRAAANAFRFLMPAAVRVFALDDASEARRWISP